MGKLPNDIKSAETLEEFTIKYKHGRHPIVHADYATPILQTLVLSTSFIYILRCLFYFILLIYLKPVRS